MYKSAIDGSVAAKYRNRQDGSAILRVDRSTIHRLRNRQLLTVQQPQNTGTILTVP